MADINILVVDDEKEIADLVEIYLVSDGYKVYKADNALAGLEILEKEDIHLVLLDIMMPGMDGLETVSYTHLDVYKRQSPRCWSRSRTGIISLSFTWTISPSRILRSSTNT